MASDLVEAAWAGERELLSPDVRRDPTRLGELLADGFVEFGQSGRRFTKSSIVAALLADPSEPVADSEIRLSDRSEQTLGPEAVLLTYLLDFGDRRSRRSSVWIRDADGVHCLFHQGTTVPAS